MRQEALGRLIEVWNKVDALDPELQDAFRLSAAQIESFHRKQLKTSWMDFSPEGALGQVVRPLERVGIYTPGGTAVYPSSLLMTAIPARVAGVNAPCEARAMVRIMALISGRRLLAVPAPPVFSTGTAVGPVPFASADDARSASLRAYEQEIRYTDDVLQRLVDAGNSVIVIEHDMDFVKQIAHKVTVMHQGKILAEGTMDQVQSDPKVIDVYLGH